jgi:hypothetical protein
VPTATGEPLSIVWEKGHNLNQFTINGASYKKVGAKAPPALSDAGFKDIFIGDKERSRGETIRPQMSDQFDRLFLLEKSGSFVSDVLSVVSRLGVLLHASGRCASDLRSAKQVLGIRRGDLADAQAAVEKIATIEATLVRVETLRAEVKAAEAAAQRLMDLRKWASVRAGLLPVTTTAMGEGVKAESLRDVLDRGSRLQRVSQSVALRSVLTPLTARAMPERVVSLRDIVQRDDNLVRIRSFSGALTRMQPLRTLPLPPAIERPNLTATLARIVEIGLLRGNWLRESTVAGLQMRDPIDDLLALRATVVQHMDRCATLRRFARSHAAVAPVAGLVLAQAIPVPEFRGLDTVRARLASLTEGAEKRAAHIEALHNAKQGYNVADTLALEATAAVDAFKAAHPSCPVCGNSWKESA